MSRHSASRFGWWGWALITLGALLFEGVAHAEFDFFRARERCNSPKSVWNLLYCMGCPDWEEGKIRMPWLGLELTAEVSFQYAMYAWDGDARQFASRRIGAVVSEAIGPNVSIGPVARAWFVGEWISVGVGARFQFGPYKDVVMDFTGPAESGVVDLRKRFGPDSIGVTPWFLEIGAFGSIIIATFQKYTLRNDENRIVGLANGQRLEIPPRANIAQGWMLSVGLEPIAILRAFLP